MSGQRLEENHAHGEGMEVDNIQFGGYPVNGHLMAELVGACLDGCETCQQLHLPLVAMDPATTGRLVSLACIAIQDKFGGIPRNLVDQDAPDQMASPEFRRAAAAGINQDDPTGPILATVTRMTPLQRQAVANTALDLVTGMLS